MLLQCIRIRFPDCLILRSDGVLELALIISTPGNSDADVLVRNSVSPAS